MSPIGILGVLFLVLASLFLGWWHSWKRAATTTVPHPKLRKFLRDLYIALTATFLILGTLLVCYRNYKITSLSFSAALLLSLAVASQAAAAGAVLTPLVIERFPGSQGFYRRLLTTECCILIPVLCALGVNLWFFVRAGESILQMLRTLRQ